jgi:GT2 family glycosyltransferase
MPKFINNATIRVRRVIHDLLILFPQGFRTSLAKSDLLTRIFVFFDDAIYLPLPREPLDELTPEAISSDPEKIPVSDYSYTEPVLTEPTNEDLRAFDNQPLVSIIMPVFDVDPKWLKLAVQSVENQWYDHWELCIVDDNSNNTRTLKYLESIRNPKIRVQHLSDNQGISVASNMALSMTTGSYIALMDHDDELTPDALFEVVKTINEHNAEFIYSDEDKLEMDGSYCEPHFKPDYSPDMFLSQNYLSHLGVIKKNLIDQVGGFTSGLEGAQDYDLYLKVLEHTDKVVHIPKVLYHWRKIAGSTAAVFNDKSYAQDAGASALTMAVQRRQQDAEVFGGKYPGTYRVKYAINALPLVSIIIPFKDKPDLLKMCIESILNKSSYSNFEIIGISNNSEDVETFAEMDRFKSLDSRISFFEHNAPFNFSDINNYAVQNHANGEHVLLLNNDIEIISPDWVESLLEFSQREDVGAVGGKLFYPDGKLQHAGIIMGIGGVAGHSHKYLDGNHHGYFSRPNIVQNLSAVTGACLMVKKSIFEEVGGLDADNLKIAFNDVDFCLRIRGKGYLNVYTPYCEAIHHESVSRGYEITMEQQDRFNQEAAYMTSRHKELLQDGDPYYNTNLTLFHEDFSLAPTFATAIQTRDQANQ